MGPSEKHPTLREYQEILMQKREASRNAEAKVGAEEKMVSFASVVAEEGARVSRHVVPTRSLTGKSGKPICSNCCGLGYLRRGRVGAIPCSKCLVYSTLIEERQKVLRQMLLEEIKRKYPPRQKVLELAERSLDLEYMKRKDYYPDLQESDIKQAVAMLEFAFNNAKRFAVQMPGGILGLHGNPGCAKTLLAAKVYRFWVKQAKAVVFLRGSELANGSFDYQNKSSFLGELIGAEGLIFDEVDRIPVGADGAGTVENLLLDVLTARMEQGRPTVVTGNNLDTRLSNAILSRFGSAGSLFLNMERVPDGRPLLDGSPAWMFS